MPAMAEAQHVICDLCGTRVPPGEHYVVRIDVYADPSVQPMSTEELEEKDFDQTFQELLEQMKGMSADDLQDDVHRRFEYRLCRSCQRRFLANPLGQPRVREVGEN
jgi:hypothetical protein